MITKGTITGLFSLRIPKDAKTINVGLGFLQGATGSDGVTFVITARSGDQKWELLKEHVKHDQVLHKTLPIPSSLLGREVNLRLRVKAGKTAGRDWSAWIRPRIQ